MAESRPTADALARSAAILFERLRELDRYDPAGAAQIRAAIAGEVRGWWQRNDVPAVVQP